MKYIIATTDNIYYRWQMLVQINNFKHLNMLDDLIYVVSVKNKRSKYLNFIEKETGVKIYTYKDEREKTSYTSSIRPHIMKKFVKDYPEYSKIMYYLDPDVIFREKPKYTNPILKSRVWFLSDTKSYIGVDYIKGKSDELLELMAEIVGIDVKTIERNDLGAGGAQYIMKNVDYEYWNKVEKDSEDLYKLMTSTTNKYNPEHPIQAWTADMWAVLWNAWYFNNLTNIHNEMSFSWATDSIKNWDNHIMLHNAGVFDQDFLFHKGRYSNKHPFNDDFSFVSDKHCSYKYLEEVLSTKKNYKELIKKL